MLFQITEKACYFFILNFSKDVLCQNKPGDPKKVLAFEKKIRQWPFLLLLEYF